MVNENPIPTQITPEIPQQPLNPTPNDPPSMIQPNENKYKKSFKYLIIGLIILLLVGFGFGAYILYDRLFNLTVLVNPINNPSPQVQPTSSPAQTTTSKNQLTNAHNSFGFNLFSKIQKEDESKNVVISPLSISLALSMTLNGADKETKDAMLKSLELPDMGLATINQKSSILMKDLVSNDPKVEISIANSIWTRKDFEINKNFISDNDLYYQAKVESLDFSNSKAADTINNWVSLNTKGKIPSIVQSPIDPLTIMYLINAVYFKGSWTNTFDKNLTTEMPFTLAGGTKKTVSMMKQTRDDFYYLENNQFQAVKLTYAKDMKLQMYLILPKNDLKTFLKDLNATNWNKWIGSFDLMEGTVYLPKYKIEYDTSLRKSLEDLGMGIAFNSGANFEKIAKNLYISEVKHKTFIEVNEEGTEAAATTSVEIAMGAIANPQKKKTFVMEINKPFFFAITDYFTNEIIFMGTITEPK